MKKEIIERTLIESEYMLSTNKTIREIAKEFKVSKSTVHKDLSSRLKNINKEKYKLISSIINEHLNTRHLKGGEATKKKYKYSK